MEESLTTKTAGRAMREGFNYVWHTPHARLLTTNIAVFSVFTLPMMVLMPVVAERFGPMVAIGSGGVVMVGVGGPNRRVSSTSPDAVGLFGRSLVHV